VLGPGDALVVGGGAPMGQAASASQMGCFETEWLARPENPVVAARASMRGVGIECDRRRRQGCALMKAKKRVPGCEAGNPTILLRTGSVAIEFRCDGTPVRRKIIRTGRESGEYRLGLPEYGCFALR
jgi:hypothetical protein